MARIQFLLFLLAAGLVASTGATAQQPIPDNIGGGLRQLVDAQRNATSSSSAFSAAALLESRVFRDSQSRVLVNIWLDGTRPLSAVRQSLGDLNANVNVWAELATFRNGVIAAYVPVEHAGDVASLPGVKSVILEHKPELRRGKITTQGAAPIHTDKLNALGLRGQGITIGALSDSFNTAPNSETHDHAAQDIKNGNLPGPGNPYGNTTPVVVVDEDPAPGTDEGRAILQIVYDIAPEAKLCFATAFTGEVQFAINILKLADPNGPCKANVIDDDVGYNDEPFFSDGVIALAVDQVVADGVAYFSSAGNENTGNYAGTFTPISNADARTIYAGNLDLHNVPTDLTAGGFHNFGTDKNVSIALPVFAYAGIDHFLVLQWNDPFYGNTPTASYDFLVFDDKGVYRPDLSGIDNVYSTSQPIQGAILPGGTAGAVYYIAIALRPGFTTPYATHLGIVDFDDGDQVTLLKFANNLAPSAYGHPAASGAIAVAADFWGNTLNTEWYSSLGPIPIYFDEDSVPLAKPEIRLKPEIAAPDGVNNSFLGITGIPGFPYPLFFGTSASAPHAAAAGALLIQAAGGPGKLSPANLKSLLEETTQQPHQLDGGLVTATLTSGADTLNIRVSGFLPDNTRAAGFLPGPQQFHFAFSGNAGDSVSRIVMNTSADNLSFLNEKGAPPTFVIGTTNIPKADIVYPKNDGYTPVETLDFLNHGFESGDFVNLGFVFVNPLLEGVVGYNADLLYGTQVTATIESGGTHTSVSGVLSGPTGKGYSVSDGYGLIDAFAAYQKLKGGASTSAVK